MNNLKISSACFAIAQEFECSGDVTRFLKAYKDSGGIWTIGIGTTHYPNGLAVNFGDEISKVQAIEYYLDHLSSDAAFVNEIVISKLTQNQFDAICDFCYNCGAGAFQSSTLLKVINSNPLDVSIQQHFEDWSEGNIDGILQTIPGLLRRRKSEAWLYFNNSLKYNF